MEKGNFIAFWVCLFVFYVVGVKMGFGLCKCDFSLVRCYKHSKHRDSQQAAGQAVRAGLDLGPPALPVLPLVNIINTAVFVFIRLIILSVFLAGPPSVRLRRIRFTWLVRLIYRRGERFLNLFFLNSFHKVCDCLFGAEEIAFH
jgi:hypothetical protein